jgi:predicted Rossmann fold nucleotide-binding protein DprA/Smf involved in DNA uptake
MLDTSMSTDAQAILMLCTSLGLSKDVKPLSLSEWNKVAAALSERKLRPGDLLGRDTAALAADTATDAVNAQRMARLLERGGQVALELERFAERGIWVVTRADSNYPRGWKVRLKHLAPVVLYGAGPLPSVHHQSMAIVGSRDADEAGLEFTRQLARACVEAGFAVVSGGARGTDAAAVAQSVELHGRAYTVLADGLEQTLKKRDTVAAVRSERLTLVSVQHPASHFSVHAAMGRNKLIYCLADWATVISSSVESGGTWAGATEDLERRWVPLFARNEPNAPDGNRRLLAMGAHSLERSHIASANTLATHLAVGGPNTAPTGAPSSARESQLDFGDDEGPAKP